MTNEELILYLRAEIIIKAAAIWFRNADLLLLEELIQRFQRQTRETTDGHAADSSGDK